MNLTVSEQPTEHTGIENDVVLSVQGVSKKFCRDFKSSLFYGVQDISQELLGLRGDKNNNLRKKEFWALQDVSLELRRGEALGLIGKNGSGKSTLLRIIAGLIKPDVGSVKVNGRVAPLIALGAGFNPVLTGRENIYANMSILGLTKEEIDERFDEVVEFAEIPDAIDAPVRSYSSGMQARLGFSCAIHTNPEILLIDEVLAVGDIHFRAKCHRKLHQLKQEGVSFILVSHQTQSMLTVCQKAVYLKKGRTIKYGETQTILTCYEKDLFDVTQDSSPGHLILPQKSPTNSRGLDIQKVFFRNKNSNITKTLLCGEDNILCVDIFTSKYMHNFGLFISVVEALGEGENILLISNFNDGESFSCSKGNHEIQVYMESLGLKPGLYDMKIIIRRDALETLDYVESFRFTVEADKSMTNNMYYQKRVWNLVSK